MTVPKTDRDQLLRKTRNADMIRLCCTEPIGAAFRGSGLGVLVALQYFDAKDWQKALIASGAFIGLMFGPLLVTLVARLNIRLNRAMAFVLISACPGFFVAAASTQLVMYMGALLISIPLLACSAPLGTAIWQQNVDESLRGKVFSQVVTVSTIAALLVSLTISYIMRDDVGQFRGVLCAFGLMSIAGAVAMWRVPSQPIPRSRHHVHPMGAMCLMREDRMFGYLCIMQMMLGLGNLATIPLRTEFLASPERGMGLSAGVVLVLTIAVPEAGRLISTLVWGRLFDHLNFIVLRLSINVIFAASIVLFFTPNMNCIILGSALFGIAMGGGKIAWSLWVTKFATPDKTADYMAVHTFLTGARGIVGPQISYAALAVMTVPQVGWIGTSLVLLSCVMLAFVLPKQTAGD